MIRIKSFHVPDEGKLIHPVVPDKDSLQTPPRLFEAISKHFGGFNLDAAANKDNAKCYWRIDDGLKKGWEIWHDEFSVTKGRVWCNPPYSAPYPWVEKAHNEVCVNHNAELAVLLLHLDPTSVLWKDYAKKAHEIYFFDRRIRFVGQYYREKDGKLSYTGCDRTPSMMMVFK